MCYELCIVEIGLDTYIYDLSTLPNITTMHLKRRYNQTSVIVNNTASHKNN